MISVHPHKIMINGFPESTSSTCPSSDNELNYEAEESQNTSTSSISSSTSTEVVSLLSRLRSPTTRLVAWEGNVSNSPTGKHQSCGATGNEPKNIQPYQHVKKKFPNEHLKVNHNKKLFCEAHREELSLKSSSLHNHLRSTKHIEGKTRLASKEARERDIAEALKVYIADNHLEGETMPESQQVF